MTGASTGRSLDGALAQADAVLFRTPYQSDPDLRKSINEGRTAFFDMHLSMMPQAVRYGFLGPVHWAVIEACDVSESGEITLTSSVGAAPTFCRVADKIIIELNRFHPDGLRGFHDIYEPEDPPYRNPLPIFRPSDRIGSPTIKVNPDKILGIVETNARRRDAAASAKSPQPPPKSARTSPIFSPPNCSAGSSRSPSCRSNPAWVTPPTPS